MSSVLLKCLECRLVGAPPVFRMPPPPAPPAEFLLNLNLNENKSITKQLKQIQLKRCLKVKNFLTNSNPSSQLQSQARSILTNTSKSSKLTLSNQLNNVKDTVVESNSLFYFLTPNQSLYIFLICFLIFLIVLTIAFVFLYKLYRLRKQLKSNSTLSFSSSSSKKCKHINTITSSLTNSSSSSCSSNSKSNTLSSHLIITPSSSLLIDSVNHNTEPTLIQQQQNNQQKFISYNLLPLYDSTSSTNSSVSTTSSTSKNAANSCLFYNQLFESTRHLFVQNNANIKNQVNSSSSSNSSTPVSCEHYLQAVPTKSNLIESHLNYKLDQMKNKKRIQQQQNCIIPSEYDEINSQMYQSQNLNPNEIYAQYEDELIKNSMIIQPIFPFKQAFVTSQSNFNNNNNLNINCDRNIYYAY